jgi:hypothetical protein
MPAKSKNRTGVGGRPQKRRENLWEQLLTTILRRIASRYSELKAAARELSKQLKKQAEISIDDISLDDLNSWNRLSSALRGQPISKETALEAAIKLEMKLLTNPREYKPQTKTKVKDHLLAWLFLNPKIKIKPYRRTITAVTPFSRYYAFAGKPEKGDETIKLNGFRFSKEDKPENTVLVKYKSACVAEIADAASKALGINVSERHINNL